MTLFELAQRFVGVAEITGEKDNPLIVWMLQLSNPDVEDDQVPWCSGFPNMCAWILRLPRSKSNAARSWLRVGQVKTLDEAELGDVIVLARGDDPLAGHVGFFAGWADDQRSLIYLLGGNQANAVTVAPFPVSRVLGVRRLT